MKTGSGRRAAFAMSAASDRLRLIPTGDRNAHDLPGTDDGLTTARQTARVALRLSPSRRDGAAIDGRHTGSHGMNGWPEEEEER